MLLDRYNKDSSINAAEVVAQQLLRARLTGKSKRDSWFRLYENCPPASILQTFVVHLKTTVDLITTPLTTYPGFQSFCSPWQEDEALGSSQHPFKVLWKGSCFCRPPNCEALTARALKWAICSAEATNDPHSCFLTDPDPDSRPI